MLVALQVLTLLTELLKAFNGLSEENRNRIVKNMLDAHDEHTARWEAFVKWIADIVNKMKEVNVSNVNN